MYCPVCKEEPLIGLEHDEIEVDYCVQCHGVWLDASEADLIFGDHDVCMTFMTSGHKPAPGQGRQLDCPICGKPMERDAAGEDNPVIYDRCKTGDGLWFDEGELARVLREGHRLEQGDKVEAFLRGLFGDPSTGGAASANEPAEGREGGNA